MVKDVIEYVDIVEGIGLRGFNITDLRYADDAVLMADKRKKMQKMLDRLSETCRVWDGNQC